MLTTTPSVTVLMTAYNREAFIGDAIESVSRKRGKTSSS